MATTFTALDYCLFVAVLAISALIGVYYMLREKWRKRETTAEDLLMGGREMGVFPVAMSLLASYMSAITVLGIPTEMYVYGVSYWLVAAAGLITFPLTCFLFLPFFHNLQLSSAYEYLELRFSRWTRYLASGIFVVQMFLYMAVVLYAPALALNQVTGFSLWGSILSVGAVVTFYTSMGGLRAVLWTDTFQTFVVAAGLFAVVIVGSDKIGGMARVWELSTAGGRTEFFNFDPSPFSRTTFWSVTVGSFVGQMTIYGASQTMLQRYMSIQIMLTALGAGGGPLLGLFSLGMFFPCVNSKGALSALLVSTIATFWVAIGAIVKQVPQPTLPFSTEGCAVTTNTSQIFNSILNLHSATPVPPEPLVDPTHAQTDDVTDVSGLQLIYKLSFLWYPTFAVIISIITGVLVSAFTGWTTDSCVDSRLIYPVHKHLCCCMPRKARKWLNCASLWTYNVQFPSAKHMVYFDDESYGEEEDDESGDDINVTEEKDRLLDRGSEKATEGKTSSVNDGFEVELETKM
ncbi:sodium-dependent multivitamin transporter [Aplysia californica]|uniref:Sodium-dependent multivitamin transporter n=1 Tax=Aplysia californica TaxID=6500 RepID=A0ABM1A3X5_APLCA|nr:sodium-dependent multivitamin transporter [Aplysia californica]